MKAKGTRKHPLVQRLEAGEAVGFGELRSDWGDMFELLDELEATAQDPEWHAEGNVAIHTESVLDEMYRLLDSEALHLSQQDRLALALAALFHDIAKPLTTVRRERDGRERLVAPRHAERGRSYLALRLHALGLESPLTKKVLALVGHHHDPRFLVIRESSAASFRRLARQVELESLYYLCVADMRGRETADRDEQLEGLELFKLLAREHGVWKRKPSDDNVYCDWRETIARVAPETTEDVPDIRPGERDSRLRGGKHSHT